MVESTVDTHWLTPVGIYSFERQYLLHHFASFLRTASPHKKQEL